MNEAENNIRRSMKNRKGTDTFVVSQRTAVYNRLLGLSDTAAYKQPAPTPKTPVSQGKAMSGEGKVDLGRFNG